MTLSRVALGAELLRTRGLGVLGVRRGGLPAGWVVPDDLTHGTLGDHAREFQRDALLDSAAGLDVVLGALADADHVFIEWLGEVAAVITRRDLQKAPLRMWLFGAITILDLNLTWAIEELYPGDTWQSRISAGRVEKAVALRAERQRRGRDCRLTDCLQITDKADILVSDPAHLAALGLRSRREADRLMRDFEALRNHLAHAQELDSEHLATAARLAAVIDSILRAEGALRLARDPLSRSPPRSETISNHTLATPSRSTTLQCRTDLRTARGATTRTGLATDEIKQAFLDNLCCGMGRVEAVATKHDLYVALALTVRDRLFQRTVESMQDYGGADARRVAYLSAEFLPGPHLANNLLNLGITEAAREALGELGHDLDEILAQEEEPGLGNGGLGRLASCYMDSLASVEVPAVGYGIRYEFGIFDQVIRDGWQQEITDKWLRFGNPWEIPRPEIAYEVKFGGHSEAWTDEQGRYRVRWVPETEVKGVAYDTPILGYRVGTCNTLRLWKAEAVESFDFAIVQPRRLLSRGR